MAETRKPLDGYSTFRSNRRSAVTWPNGSTNRSTSSIRRAEAISRHLGALRPESIGGASDNSDPVTNKDSVVGSQRYVARSAKANRIGILQGANDRRSHQSAVLFAVHIRDNPNHQIQRAASGLKYLMSNIAKMLREEITKIARRESRASLEQTRKVLSQQRQEIASLKARLKSLERSASAAERDQPRTAVGPLAEASTMQVRFMPKGIVSVPQRLGLSVADLAKLLSVSDQTVYNWERGVSRPRLEHRSKLASLRRVGKRELQNYLSRSEASG